MHGRFNVCCFGHEHSTVHNVIGNLAGRQIRNSGLVGKDIVVRLKWGETEYKGNLVSLDSYLNLQLSNTVEYIKDKPTGELGQVLIR